MSDNDNSSTQKEEIKKIEVKAKEFKKKRLTLVTGKTYDVIIETEKILFSE